MKNNVTLVKSDKKIDKIIFLLQHLIAIELSKGGISQPGISKSLGIRTATVNKMLKGLGKAK